MNPTTQDFGPCPCQEWNTRPCVEGTKLTRRGHLVGCLCNGCIGLRNKRKGQKTEAKRHRRLGGEGQTPRDELAYSYSINVTTEDKGGKQIPQAFRRFLVLEWTRHALRQAEKKIPVGSDALPALWLDVGPAGTWLLVRVPERGLR